MKINLFWNQYYNGGWVQFTVGFLPALLVAGVIAALFGIMLCVQAILVKRAKKKA